MFYKEISLVLYVSLYIGSQEVSALGSHWPSGWYGLPQPKSGCPSIASYEWGSGWWYEDRRLNYQSTARVPQYSHLKGTFNKEITKRYFCMKKKDNGLNKPWLNGQYCIYQGFLKPCPPGFVKGSIGWKNKDAPNNNHHSPGGGSINLPNGVYTRNTRINYCCKVDGSKENSISLPINRPFLLLAYNSSQCQSVKWARTTQEYLRFSVQENMTFQGFHPFVDDNYALRYCYYQGSNQTLTSLSGTISRYLNQTSIHQERYTAWHINPYSSLSFQLLVLRFTLFIFHASNITSYLEVFDGPNESAASLGRFSSTQSPLGQNITSSTNQLFVVLQFGDRIGMYDFEFSYHIYSPTVSTTAEMKTPSHPPTSSTTKMTSSSPYTSSTPYESSSSHTPPTTHPSTSSSPYTSPSKVTSLPSTTKYFTKSTILSSNHHTNVTIPTNITHLYSHGNDTKARLLLYILLPAGVLVVAIGITVIIVRRRKKRIAYSRLTSLSIDEIVTELNDNMDGEFERIEPSTSCAVLQVTSDEHELEGCGMSTRTRLKLMDTTGHTPSDSDDEMIQLDRNPPDFPSTELQDVNTRPRPTSPPCRYESDPVPDHSRDVSNDELRQLQGKVEGEISEAERIALIRLLGENHQEQYQLPKPKPNVARDQASDC